MANESLTDKSLVELIMYNMKLLVKGQLSVPYLPCKTAVCTFNF